MADRNPAVSQQRATIPNKFGENLVGVLHSTGSNKVVVLCHGFRSSKEDKTIVNLIAALTSQGISAFHFDFSGNGESDGEFEFGNYHKEAEDLRAVIEYLSKEHEISAILGHSKGGDVVVLYASTYHDVPMVINVSGRFALDKGLENRLGEDFMQRIKQDGFIDVKNRSGNVEFRVTEESLMERLNTNMHAASLSIDSKCRVLTVHGSADEIIPVEDAFEFAKLIPNHILHIVEGANHNYTAHQEQLASVVLDFLKSEKPKTNRTDPNNFSINSQTMADQNPVVSQQRMRIPNKFGENLVGVLHKTGSNKVVVLCHGFRSSKEDITMLNLIAALTSQGISAFHFDFSGNGESEGEFEFGNYRKEVEDLRAVIEYLSKAHEVSTILGHSKGGNVVLLYASTYHDIPTVINVSGRFALDEGLENRFGKEYLQKIKNDGFIDMKNRSGNVEFRATEESLMERLNTNMHAASLSIDKECRVLTVHGSADEIIPIEDAFKFAKFIPNHKLHVVEGANHGYTAHQEQLASVVLDFIKSNQVVETASSGDV